MLHRHQPHSLVLPPGICRFWVQQVSNSQFSTKNEQNTRNFEWMRKCDNMRSWIFEISSCGVVSKRRCTCESFADYLTWMLISCGSCMLFKIDSQWSQFIGQNYSNVLPHRVKTAWSVGSSKNLPDSAADFGSKCKVTLGLVVVFGNRGYQNWCNWVVSEVHCV